eukprot:TRINITY_DN19062_c0_g1_i5.p1 TRINITY_DN19062_c0_g1~~TRINITY_DN19062_c0_g1_i5.p1  ORF type:complete len:285 (+),score=44.44 TRINITY_DN19062_c0_g1_i5:166-1020(+)
MLRSLVGSEMCIRDRVQAKARQRAEDKAAKLKEEREELVLEANAGSATAKAALQRLGRPVVASKLAETGSRHPPHQLQDKHQAAQLGQANSSSPMHHVLAGDYRTMEPDHRNHDYSQPHHVLAGDYRVNINQPVSQALLQPVDTNPPTSRKAPVVRRRRSIAGVNGVPGPLDLTETPADLVRINQLMDDMIADRNKWEAEFSAQAIRQRSGPSGSIDELASDSRLVYSKWSNAVGKPSAAHVVGSRVSFKQVATMDVMNAGADQLDLLLEQFMRKPLPLLPDTP